jgi:hypothetical protein
LATGTIAKHPGQHGKITSIDFSVGDGRVQDLLRLFVKAERPPLNGIASFHAHVTVVPQARPFLEEVALTGDFGIEEGRFVHPKTQKNVADLSARSEGEKQENDDPDRFNAFFKKKHAGAVIPVKLTGTYSDPQPGLDLRIKK